jgi:hypothetical protein
MASSTFIRAPKANSLQRLAFRGWTPVWAGGRSASLSASTCRRRKCDAIASHRASDEVAEELEAVSRASLVAERPHGPENLIEERNGNKLQLGPGLTDVRESGSPVQEFRIRAPDCVSSGRLFASRSSMAWVTGSLTILLPAIFAYVAIKLPFSSFSESQAGEPFAVTSSSSPLTKSRAQLRSALEPQLVINGSHANAGEPVPLDVTIQGRAAGGVAVIRGLIPGMSLSSGTPISNESWEVPATDLANTWVGPPVGFAGVVSLTAELQVDGARVIDPQPVRIEWRAATPLPAQVRATTALSENASALQELAQDDIVLRNDNKAAPREQRIHQGRAASKGTVLIPKKKSAKASSHRRAAKLPVYALPTQQSRASWPGGW